MLRPDKFMLVVTKASAQAYVPLRDKLRSCDRKAELMDFEAAVLGAWPGVQHHEALHATRSWVEALKKTWGHEACTRDWHLERERAQMGASSLCWKFMRATGSATEPSQPTVTTDGTRPAHDSGEAEAVIELRWCPVLDAGTLSSKQTSYQQLGLARSRICNDMEHGFLKIKGEARPACVTCVVCRGCTYPCRLVHDTHRLEHPKCRRQPTTWSGRPVQLCAQTCRCSLSIGAGKALDAKASEPSERPQDATDV